MLLIYGAALLAVSVYAATWPLTELTARAVGAWLIGLEWAAAQGRSSGDLRTVRPVALTSVVFVILQALALLRYGDALAWPTAPAMGFITVLLAIGVAGRMGIGAVAFAGCPGRDYVSVGHRLVKQAYAVRSCDSSASDRSSAGSLIEVAPTDSQRG